MAATSEPVLPEAPNMQKLLCATAFSLNKASAKAPAVERITNFFI